MLTDSGRCPEHAKQVRGTDQRSKSASAKLYDHRWRKASKAYLAKHPLCDDCLETGRTTAATVVDHIIPHRGDKRLFWDEDNWAGRCKSHHDSKTARMDRPDDHRTWRG